MSEKFTVQELLDLTDEQWVPDTQLTGELFADASEFALPYHKSWQWWRRAKYAMQHSAGFRAYRRWLADLPTVTATLPSGPVADEVQFWLEHSPSLPSLKDGTGSAILPLPPTLADYRRGRSRQAMRTNVTKAGKLGLTVHEVPAVERRTAVQEILVRRNYFDIGGKPGDWMSHSWRPNLKHDARYVVREADGRIICLGTMLVCGDLAFLVLMVAAMDVPEASPARYLMHQTLVEHAINHGAKALVAESTVVNDGGLQKFQGLLGYHCANVEIEYGPVEPVTLPAAPLVSASGREATPTASAAVTESTPA